MTRGACQVLYSIPIGMAPARALGERLRRSGVTDEAPREKNNKKQVHQSANDVRQTDARWAQRILVYGSQRAALAEPGTTGSSSSNCALSQIGTIATASWSVALRDGRRLSSKSQPRHTTTTVGRSLFRLSAQSESGSAKLKEAPAPSKSDSTPRPLRPLRRGSLASARAPARLATHRAHAARARTAVAVGRRGA